MRKHSPLKYARIPLEVLLDKKLSVGALRVYGVFASSVYQGRVASMGMRQIGEASGSCAATARKRIAELLRAGYVAIHDAQRGKRTWYSLTSPVFGQKQGQVEEVYISPDGSRRRLVSVEQRRPA